MTDVQKTTTLEETANNLETDYLLQTNYDKMKKLFGWRGFRTSTHISYKAGSTEALIWNEGDKKKTKIFLPLNDGWYIPDKKFGIPNGAPSNDSNPEARYLIRRQRSDYEGLLVRWCYGRFVVDGRGVVAGYGYVCVCGVRKVKIAPHKHEWEQVCKTCGVKK